MSVLIEQTSARDFFPKKITLDSLRHAAKKCEGCHLYRYARQTVFSEGPADAKLMIVGEIPGEKEDDLGRPFVGPAGIFLRKSIDALGMELTDIYFTNVVKHFKFSKIHKRKLHRTPIGPEIRACKPWLEAEIDVINPQLILCLGGTAAKTLIDKKFNISKKRGRWFSFSAHTRILATYHPSAILRAPDSSSRHRMKRLFMNDLKKVANLF